MNSNLKMRRLAGIQTPSFYGYVKSGDVKVASKETITESYWEAIPQEDKGMYNGEKHVLIVEMGLLKVAPVQVLNMMAINDMKSKEKAKTDGAPVKTELKNLGTDLSTKDGKVADTDAKALKDVKEPTTMTNMKSGEKSKTDGEPKSTEMKHLSDAPSTKDGKIADTEAKNLQAVKTETKMTDMKSAEKSKTDGAPKSTELKHVHDSLPADGGDPEKTAAKVIADVKSGNRKTDTKGVVKEDLEDLEGDEAEEGEDEPEVSCDECGGTFKGKKIKTVATCDQHKGMTSVGGEADDAEDEEEEEAMNEAVVTRYMKGKLMHDSGKELKVGDKVKDFRDSEHKIEGWSAPHKTSSEGHVHTDKGSYYPSVINSKIVDHDLKESAEEMAKRLIASVNSGKRITDTSEVDIDSSKGAEKYKSKLADYMPKNGKVADTEAKKLTSVKEPTTLSDMKSKEKAKTDGAPKKTELKSDTPAQVEGLDSKKKSEIVSESKEDTIEHHAFSHWEHSEKSKENPRAFKGTLTAAERDKHKHHADFHASEYKRLTGKDVSEHKHADYDPVTGKTTYHNNVKEAWDTDYETPKSKRGMFDGKSKEELESELAKLKKSGPILSILYHHWCKEDSLLY